MGKKRKVHAGEGKKEKNPGVKQLKIVMPTAFMYAWENGFKGGGVGGGGVLALGVNGRNAKYIPLNTYLGPPYTLEFQKLFDFVIEYYYIITLLLT